MPCPLRFTLASLLLALPATPALAYEVCDLPPRYGLSELAIRIARVACDENRQWYRPFIGLDGRLATRRVTERADHDPEVLERTRKLDLLKQAERQALRAVEAQQQAALDARQTAAATQRQLSDLEADGYTRLQQERRKLELRVFLYRLALTLPLLVAAGWLFAKKRHSTYWPFVWGFIFFALFAFFVELVPYLPSYGGYVRYVVGIGITVLVGRYAILALNRYLERQKLAEAMPDAQRREELSYDVALARLAKNVCPGCERPVDLKNETIDFCPHCGIGLFDRCGQCTTRKSAFAHFCHACGTSAKLRLASEA